MSVDLKELCERLGRYASEKPSAAVRKEVEVALESKWEGVQVAAAKTLGAWGDKRSLQLIRLRLEALAKLEARWGAIGAIATAIAPSVSKNDINWVLALYLKGASPHNRFSLLHLVAALPATDTEIMLQTILDEGREIDRRNVLDALRAMKSASSNAV